MNKPLLDKCIDQFPIYSDLLKTQTTQGIYITQSTQKSTEQHRIVLVHIE